MVIPYQHLGTTHQPHLQGPRNPKREQSTTDVETIFFFGTLFIVLFFKEA
jgi:hypothetical protein